jgi:hypothetical protein
VQSWIDRYERQLAAGRAEIEAQRERIAELRARIRALEARAKSDAATSPAAPAPAVENPGAAPAEPKADRAGETAAVFDRIVEGPMALVSISMAKHRILIYATGAHRSRTYVIPHDMKSISVSFHGDDVIIVANGPHGAHLADYNLNTDRWALQDVRGGRDGRVEVVGMPATQAWHSLLPCVLEGSGFTQVALFDFKRASWTVQNLLEPSPKSVEPIVRRQVAIYVLGRHVYAYSGETGTWDTLTLEEPLLPEPARRQGVNGSPVLLQDGMCAVSQDGRLHLFTAGAGRWQTVNPKD